MTPIAGGAALNLAFGFGILTILTIFFYTRNGDQRLYLTGQRLALGVSFLFFSYFYPCLPINNQQF